jgi:hypothetical protein
MMPWCIATACRHNQILFLFGMRDLVFDEYFRASSNDLLVSAGEELVTIE